MDVFFARPVPMLFARHWLCGDFTYRDANVISLFIFIFAVDMMRAAGNGQSGSFALPIYGRAALLRRPFLFGGSKNSVG